MESARYSAVGIVPVYKKGKGEFLFCIVQEADGHWGFPKGHREEGESDEDAAVRELREETGVENVDLQRGQTFSEHYAFVRDGGRVEKTVTYMIGFVDSMEEKTDEAFAQEITEVQWLPYERAKETLTYKEGKDILEQVYQALKSDT